MNFNTNTNNTTNIKEEKSMNNNINFITGEPRSNYVELVKKNNTTYIKFNDMIVGAIGGDKTAQEANCRCIQFIVDNCDKADGVTVAKQATMLTAVMADLENVSLENTLVVNKVEYAIDTVNKKAYTENGQVVIDLIKLHPELDKIILNEKAIEAIIVAEINKLDIAPIAVHYEEEENNEINITKNRKLSVFETIKGLRALGMSASWFNVEGVKQFAPICYNGVGDLGAFKKVVKECLESDKNWLDIVISSCQYKENNINPDNKVYTIEGIECIIDYDSKNIWDINGIRQFANLNDIEYNLPKEAVEVMLIDRARQAIISAQEENCFEDEYDDDYYDEYDNDDCDF